MQTYLFDDRNITWQMVETIGAQIYVLSYRANCDSGVQTAL
jgi:hypothetical protein